MITAQICDQEPRVSLLLGTLGGASESLPLPQRRVKPTQGPACALQKRCHLKKGTAGLVLCSHT